jgi:CRP-like cAMP-binding protein
VKRFARSTVIYNEEDKGEEFFILGTKPNQTKALRCDETRWLWFAHNIYCTNPIVEGEVDMTALDADKQDQFLCSKKPGDFFGERAILVQECQREVNNV